MTCCRTLVLLTAGIVHVLTCARHGDWWWRLLPALPATARLAQLGPLGGDTVAAHSAHRIGAKACRTGHNSPNRCTSSRTGSPEAWPQASQTASQTNPRSADCSARKRGVRSWLAAGIGLSPQGVREAGLMARWAMVTACAVAGLLWTGAHPPISRRSRWPLPQPDALSDPRCPTAACPTADVQAGA